MGDHRADAAPWPTGHPFAADIPLTADSRTARGLAEALGIGQTPTNYTLRSFIPRSIEWTFTLTSDAMARALAHIETLDPSAGRPNVWYPNDRTWAANAPYDMRCTYVASGPAAAERLLSHPDLEAFSCAV